MDERRACVGVVPARTRTDRTGLFDALELAYPVRFEGREPGGVRGLDALLAFGVGDGPAAADRLRIPFLGFCSEESDGEPQRFTLANDPGLAEPLRGAHLSEDHAAQVPPLPSLPRSDILGEIDGSPAWLRRSAAERTLEYVAVAPADLEPGEVLRNRLRPGRCLALLPLVEFLRRLTSATRWRLPPARAAFVIDDPNLRWPTYGHLSYQDLARSAAAHSYHVSIAMVPLEARPAHRRAVATFRGFPQQLSLSIHGNDHFGGELGRLHSPPEALAQVAQALRRVEAFERRTGLGVDRVMVPPHEQVSEDASAALLACGYEAVAATRTYPWIGLGSSPDVSWLTRPQDSSVLTGWSSAVIMPGGFPLLLRMPLEYAQEEQIFRSFLGQPVVLYGHHELLQHGPALLEAAAAVINRFGDVSWSSLAGIARGAVEHRRRGDTLQVRMFGRQIHIAVPSWATEVEVDARALGLPARSQLHVRGAAEISALEQADGRALLKVDCPGPVDISAGIRVDPRSVPAPRWRLTPVARRLAAEVRPRTRQIGLGRRATE